MCSKCEFVKGVVALAIEHKLSPNDMPQIMANMMEAGCETPSGILLVRLEDGHPIIMNPKLGKPEALNNLIIKLQDIQLGQLVPMNDEDDSTVQDSHKGTVH